VLVGGPGELRVEPQGGSLRHARGVRRQCSGRCLP
jgi:hypothetical protein